MNGHGKSRAIGVDLDEALEVAAKIPGADVQNINVQSCNNPTFTPSGFNLLAETAPYPPACDKQGPIQCTSGSGRPT